MEGREAMAMSGGSAQHFIHKTGLGSASGSQPSGFIAPPPHFRALASNRHHHVQAAAAAAAAHSGIRALLTEQAFAEEMPPPPGGFSHGRISTDASSAGPPSGEQPLKKKRGRPRKYTLNAKVALGLLPSSVTPIPKKARGRPPGSGWKQRLAAVGEWMNSSAGLAFAPHVIIVGAGEDVAAKILSFSQQRPRAVSILSGCGTISLVTLKQPTSSNGTISFQGQFEILCLSGSYLVAEEGGPRDRAGGISASLSSSDGRVIGGSVGMLIAASPVQVVVCSFVYDDTPKAKEKQIVVADAEIKESDNSQSGDRSFPSSSKPTQNLTSSAPCLWQNPQTTGIDLTYG
ncbi:hypothetical protein SAY86_000870 [Trapa natans]|uniref:AT-hook motif nuclear-localized protein n=1 Tax=Trapa natans TaxID=22666 RepID=A0AAN7RG00_TRANT|nr:hypothetical protein SAY86_000870 [Trapa natans]